MIATRVNSDMQYSNFGISYCSIVHYRQCDIYLQLRKIEKIALFKANGVTDLITFNIRDYSRNTDGIDISPNRKEN